MTSKGFNALRRQGVDFKWTAELEKDFFKLKEDFKENNTRSFPIYSSDEPFILTIDFSALALGVTLSKKQSGKEQLAEGLHQEREIMPHGKENMQP